MDKKASLENVTAEIIEACMDRDVNETSEDYDAVQQTDAWAEHEKFRNQIVGSPRLRSAMILMAASLRSDKFDPDNPPTVEAAVRMYEAGEVTDWHLELAISACREWFFHGWHSRGALDDAGLLKWLVHGEDRRHKQ
jgi:hypothetical protein